jgi:4-hydroxy-tetrahydrodipicolinate synthase
LEAPVTKASGVYVPFITPFTADDTVDLAALRDHIDFLIENGVHGLIPTGSTGEAQSLSPDEYRTVVSETLTHVAGRVPVFVGCSANATRQVIANCNFAEAHGATGLMITHPFYSLPDENELYHHYATIARNVGIPIMVYNNPFTTGVDSKPELLGRLSELDHIEYVKESSLDSSRIVSILEESNGRLVVFSGTDNQALEHMSVGALGWVSGAANVIPSQCVELFSLSVERGRHAEALQLYRRIYPYLNVCEGTGKFVQVAKLGLELRGRPVGKPRAPLLPVDAQIAERTRVAVDRALGAPVLA